MGTKSTAVKRCRRYRVQRPGGEVSRVLEIAWVDPGRPGRLNVERFEQVHRPAVFIPLTFTAPADRA